MIKSKQGKRKPQLNILPAAATRQSNYDAVLKNYKCLFCQRPCHLEDIYDSRCACGGQWFEKRKVQTARRLAAY